MQGLTDRLIPNKRITGEDKMKYEDSLGVSRLYRSVNCPVLELVVEANQQWAKNCSVLCFAVCNTKFSRNGKDNDCVEFDTGAARMSLAYQARTMGLCTHGMGGIDHSTAARFLGLPSDKEVIFGIAIGLAAPHESLDKDKREKEKPTGRKPLGEVLRRV